METNQNRIRSGAIIFANAADILSAVVKGGLDEKNSKNKDVLLQNIIPEIVLKAFSCELFIKSLIPQDNVGNIREHKLDALFNLLNQNDRDLIQKSVISSLSKDKVYNVEKFMEDLQEAANVFVAWRYFYEEDNRTINIEFLNTLFNTLSNYKP